jgi:hypothetical protein
MYRSETFGKFIVTIVNVEPHGRVVKIYDATCAGMMWLEDCNPYAFQLLATYRLKDFILHFGDLVIDENNTMTAKQKSDANDFVVMNQLLKTGDYPYTSGYRVDLNKGGKL